MTEKMTTIVIDRDKNNSASQHTEGDSLSTTKAQENNQIPKKDEDLQKTNQKKDNL